MPVEKPAIGGAAAVKKSMPSHRSREGNSQSSGAAAANGQSSSKWIARISNMYLSKRNNANVLNHQQSQNNFH